MWHKYVCLRKYTFSPAVPARPRDASCLSVVSFSSIQYVERSILSLVTSASDLPLRTNKFCSVLFSSAYLLTNVKNFHGSLTTVVRA